MKELFTFDDVLIVPKFSDINSRRQVTLQTKVGNQILLLPVIAANMDTITGTNMAKAMAASGATSCLHRFSSLEENVVTFKEAGRQPMVSIGLGDEELRRAEALLFVGATQFVIDVAHGAQQAAVDQARRLRELTGDNAYVVVGNFASDDSVKQFLDRFSQVSAIKVGVGPGSACTTRIKTGVGVPQLSAVMQIAQLVKKTDIQVIADGGMKTPGDIAKAFGAGAHLVMLGGMLAGTEETPGDTVNSQKKYRGSASKESYEVQGKDASWRTAEGESFTVPCKGPVANILQDIEGGLRSAMTYVGASTLDEFRAKCEFVRITNSTVRENGAHGKT